MTNPPWDTVNAFWIEYSECMSQTHPPLGSCFISLHFSIGESPVVAESDGNQKKKKNYITEFYWCARLEFGVGVGVEIWISAQIEVRLLLFAAGQCTSSHSGRTHTWWMRCQINKIHNVQNTHFGIHPTSKCDTLRLDFSSMVKQMPAASNHIGIGQRVYTPYRCAVEQQPARVKNRKKWDRQQKKKKNKNAGKSKIDSTQQKSIAESVCSRRDVSVCLMCASCMPVMCVLNNGI